LPRFTRQTGSLAMTFRINLMKKYWPVLTILLVTLLAFYPVFGGRIPLNARNLVSFFSPWYYQKFPGFPAGVPSKPGMLDQIRLYYPYMRLTQESYRLGELPLWNPYNFAGNPHMAEWQSGAFYPLHILLPFLPLPVYWTLYQMLGFFLAGWFMFLFLRNLKLGIAAALLGAITFMLSSFMTTWNMEVVTAPHSILWLPLILLSIDRIINPSSIIHQPSSIKKWWLVGLTGLVMSILSGYWQTTFYVMAVAAVYILYRLWRQKLLLTFYSLLLTLLFPLSLALTAFQLLPTWELYQRSSRPLVNSSPRLQEILTEYLLPVRHLVTLFAPDYFGHPTTRNYFANVGGGTYYEHVLFFGTLPLFFAMLAFLRRRRIGRDVWFWLIVAIGFGSLSFDLPWSRWIYQVKIPVLSTGIANRVLFVPAFAGAVLASFGLESMKEKLAKNSKILMAGIWIGGLIILAATWFFRNGLGAVNPVEHPDLYLISLRNMVIPTAVLILAMGVLWFCHCEESRWPSGRRGNLKTRLPRPDVTSGLAMTFTILILAVIQNLYQHHKFTAFSEKEFIYPETKVLSWLKNNAGLNRFLGYNGQFLNNDFATALGIYTVEGYDSLNDSRRAALVQSAVDGKLNPQLPTSADVELDRNLKNERVVKLMRLFGVRYLVDHPEWLDVGPTAGLARLSVESEKLVFQDGDWKIWEYLDAYPRAFLAGDYEVAGDGQETIDRLYSDDFNPGETLLLSEPVPAGFEINSDESGSVTIEKYTPTRIIFNTKSKTNQLLFLSDTYYPGWWYKVDNGKKQPVLAADYALRAAPIPAGEHTITMWYFPESFKKGIIISAITFMTIMIIIRIIKTKR